MDIKTISVAFVAIMVGAVAFGAMLPVFQDVTATEDTYTNQGYFYVDNPTTETVLALNDGVLTVNGVSVNPGVNSTYPDGVSVVITENAIFRYYDSELRSRGGLIGYHAFNQCELTFNNGTLTGTYTSTGSDTPTSVSETYTSLTIISPTNTDVVMCKPTPQYVNEDSIISGAGVIATPNQSTKYWVAEFTGSIEDGITAKIFGQSTGSEPTNTTIENATINYTEDNGHNDLYAINSITFDVVGSDQATDHVTFTIYMVPSEVTAERSVIPDSSFSVIVDLIPLVIGMGLLLIAVWWFVVRKF